MEENELNKRLRSLKKYCPQSYKYLIFKFKNNNTFSNDGEYELELPTSSEFKFIYGVIKVKYIVKSNVPRIIEISPDDFLLDGYLSDLDCYRGMFYRNEKDKFKIDMMYALRK